MKRLVFALVFLTACASSNPRSTGPDVKIELAQLNTANNIFYFAGPISVQYQVSVTNPTNQPITLRRLELQTTSPGAYALRASGNLNLPVPPNATATTTINAWGRSRGGYLTSGEPVTMRVTGVFDDGSGHSFSRISLENLPQM